MRSGDTIPLGRRTLRVVGFAVTAAKKSNSQQQTHCRFNQKSEVVAINKLSETAIHGQRLEQKPLVVLHGLSQNSEDAADDRDQDDSMHQHA